MSGNPLAGFNCPHCGRANLGGFTGVGLKEKFEPANQPQKGSIGICDMCMGVFEMTSPLTAVKRQPEDFPDIAQELKRLQKLIVEAHVAYSQKRGHLPS